MPYLIRHTQPDIAAGICYGQSNIEVADSFFSEAGVISHSLPKFIPTLFYSPLKRCTVLAEYLAQHHQIGAMLAVPELMEMHFGHWEMKAWDAINKKALQVWMEKFDTEIVPGGESFYMLHKRTCQWWDLHGPAMDKNSVIITHAGSIRSLLSYFNNTPLKRAFELYKIPYGMVISL